MSAWILLSLGVIALLNVALVSRVMWRIAYGRVWIAGFKDGRAFQKAQRLELRNVEVVKPESFTAADRAILAALLELDRSDRETIH